MALVATIGSGAKERLIAVVRYEGITPTEAEVAFVVEDPWQHHGLGRELFLRLACYSRAQGFHVLFAEVLGGNVAMRNLLCRAGFPYSAQYADGCVELRLDITEPPVAAS
jgi:RimJ/RimL family protein N-acetyltransferase